MLGGTLIFKNAEIRDSGRYVCVLQSSGNEDKAETELIVTGIESFVFQSIFYFLNTLN